MSTSGEDGDGGGPDTTKTPLVELGGDGNGGMFFAGPYNRAEAVRSVGGELSQQVNTEIPDAPEDEKADADQPAAGQTPGPETETTVMARGEGGPIRRFNDVFTDLGSVALESIALDGFEIANATATLRNELYRNSFPLVRPKFAVKGEDSEKEYDEHVPFDVAAARQEMMEDGVENPPTGPEDIPEEYRDHDVRPPRAAEKREAEQMTDSVNKEGQSLRELMQMCEDDQSRMGVSTIVARKDYVIAAGDIGGVYDRGEVIHESVDELIRGDPKRIVPVVDEDGRVGNYWWTCPIHRDGARTQHQKYVDNNERTCEECGADLREVFFVETSHYGRGGGTRGDIEKYYFQDEIVTWARYYPRLHGLDGLSPTHHVWLKQSILHWMDIYGGAYYDPESDKYPKKFMVVHTTNPETWKKQFKKSEEDADENPYSEQVLVNQYSGDSRSTPEVQTIDLMQDELLGQDDTIKKRYKSDIRQAFGVTDIFDSELSDASGLNNEGLQMEVTDRNVAAAMHDTETGPLRELAQVLGIEDHEFKFLPPKGTDPDELLNHLRAGDQAAQSGLNATLEDEHVQVEDGDFEAPEEPEGAGGGGGLAGLLGGGGGGGPGGGEEPDDEGGGLMGMAEDSGEPEVSHKFDPIINGHESGPLEGDLYCEEYGASFEWHEGEDYWSCPLCGEDVVPEQMQGGEDAKALVQKAVGEDPWSAGFDAYRVLPAPDDDTDYGADVIGVAADFPNDAVYVDWNNEAFPDELDESHVSIYGSIEDLTKATGNVCEGFNDGGGGQGTGNWLPEGVDEEKLRQTRLLEKAFDHIVWADDEHQKASPFWREDEVVPEFVEDLIRETAHAAVFDDIQSLDGDIEDRVADMFVENLTQPQGWSLRSLAADLQQEFNLDKETAELVGRTESAAILNDAREVGYERATAAAEEEPVFKWIGPGHPDDGRTTDACVWLKRQTDPRFGGTPVTLDRLKELEKIAHERYFPDLEFREHCVHPHERHTFVEHFKAALEGDIEGLKQAADFGPAFADAAGTFALAA